MAHPSRLGVALLIVALGWPMRAYSQQPPADAGSELPPTISVSMRLLPSSNPAVLRAMLSNLADLSVLESVPVPANTALEDVLRRRCGSASQALVTIIRGQNPSFGESVSAEDRAVRLFACPYWEFDKEVAAPADGLDGATKLLREHVGNTGPRTQSQVLARNTRLKGSFKNLRKGQSILLPYITRPFSLRLRADDVDPERRVRKFQQRYANLVLRTPDAEAHIALVAEVTPLDVDPPDDSCRVADDLMWPFDRQRVRRLLIEDLGRGVPQLGAATIVVADTGFDEADILRLYVRDNPGEGAAEGRDQNNKDDDHDGFRDDRFGANMDPAGGFPARNADFERSEHGTNVSAVALGGMQDDPLTRTLKGHLSISMANILRPFRTANTAPAWWITTTALENSLRFAQSTDAGIVNWSIESSEDMGTVKAALDRLRDRLKPLVVIAAGNSGTLIDSVGSYPASYRREVPDRIITVAAHNPEGTLLNWSNYGSEVVDIAAPGCGIDTMSPGGERRRVSGTSFAAPLVSFTAALLQAEGLTDPSMIKWRIISTAALDPRLEDYVASRGRLDIPKALAVAYDVIEMATAPSGEDRLRFGQIVSPREIDLCGQTVPMVDLLRIAPNYQPGSDTPTLVQWFTYEEHSGAITGIATKQCAVPTFNLRFKDSATKTEEDVAISSLIDFVPRRR